MSEIHQYKLRNGSSPAWYDEGTGPTPDAWHLDCVQPDHIWRTVYQQGHEAALSQPAGEPVAWRFVTENRRHGPQRGHWRDVKDAGMPPQSEDLADGVTVEFAYTTPQPSADAVRELVLLSRGLAKRTFNRSTAEMYIHFADKLESLLCQGNLPAQR